MSESTYIRVSPLVLLNTLLLSGDLNRDLIFGSGPDSGLVVEMGTSSNVRRALDDSDQIFFRSFSEKREGKEDALSEVCRLFEAKGLKCDLFYQDKEPNIYTELDTLVWSPPEELE